MEMNGQNVLIQSIVTILMQQLLWNPIVCLMEKVRRWSCIL